MPERRGRSPSPSRQRLSSPAVGISAAQDDEIASDRAFSRVFRLYDNKFQIRPWGFVNRATEEKFVEYHWLTFTTNYKKFISRFFGAVALLQGVFAARQFFVDEDVLPVALSLLRVAVSSVVAVLFSGRNNVFIKRGWELITLVYFQGILPFFYYVEFINPATSQMKITIAAFICTAFGFLFMPCSWRGMCWVYCTAFWVPAGIIFHTTWEEEETHMRMMLRAQLLPIAGTVGPLIGAIFSVDYRRSWALASRRAGRSTDPKQEDVPVELLRRRRSSARSPSPLSRWAASGDRAAEANSWWTRLGIARSRRGLRLVREQDSE